MKNQYRYIKFIIQLTFISNGFWLVDLVHRSYVWVNKWLHDSKHKESVLKPPFKDDYVFDLGYHQSYSLVIFLNCLIFSTIVPIIPMYAFFFFSIKYFVDKYNLIFVYYKIFESGGKIRKHVTNYMFFNLFLYLVMIIFFYKFKFEDQKYLVIGFVMIIAWIMFYYWTKSSLKEKHNLDDDLRKHRGLRPALLAQNALSKFNNR